jgi:hypothetical protein
LLIQLDPHLTSPHLRQSIGQLTALGIESGTLVVDAYDERAKATVQRSILFDDLSRSLASYGVQRVRLVLPDELMQTAAGCASMPQ